jgi:hypothetical protein
MSASLRRVLIARVYSQSSRSLEAIFHVLTPQKRAVPNHWRARITATPADVNIQKKNSVFITANAII